MAPVTYALASRTASLSESPLARPAGDRGRQRATGAVGVFGGNARRGKARAAFGFDQQVDALDTAAVTALDEHRAGTERQQLFRLRAHLALILGHRHSRSAAASNRLGVKTRALGINSRGERIERIGAQQLRAGAGSQNRIEHDVAARARATEGGTDGFER